MKICSVCNEIVSANQMCALSNCPNKSSARPAPKSGKVTPGPTGRSDRAVQAGLDRAGDVARDATRRAVFAGATTLAVAVAAAFLLLTNTGNLTLIPPKMHRNKNPQATSLQHHQDCVIRLFEQVKAQRLPTMTLF